MSTVISLTLADDQAARLQRAAQSLGRTPDEAATLLLEEALRERDFPFIEFRDSAAGRQPYLQGTRLAVWQVALIARGFNGDIAQTATYLSLEEYQVRAVLNYAAAYAEEIEAAIQENDANEARIQNLIPGVRIVRA